MCPEARRVWRRECNLLTFLRYEARVVSEIRVMLAQLVRQLVAMTTHGDIEHPDSEHQYLRRRYGVSSLQNFVHYRCTCLGNLGH